MSTSERPAVTASRSAVSGVGGRAGRDARPARRGRGPGSRRAGPGPPRPAGAGRPRGAPRAARPRSPGPAGRSSSQRPRPTRSRTWRSSASVGRAPADPEVLGDGRVEEVGVLVDQPDDRAHVVAGEPVDAVRRSRVTVAGRRSARKRRSTAARVDLPAPLGPTMATRRPGGSVEVDAAQGRRRGARVAGPHRARAPGRVRAGRAAARGPDRARSPGPGRRSRRTPGPRPGARALQGLGGDRQADDQLEGGQRDQGDDRQQRAAQGDPSAPPGCPPARQPQQARPASSGGQGEPDAGGAGRGGGDATSGRRRVADPVRAGRRSRPKAISSGAPSMRSTTARRARRAPWRDRDSRRRARTPVSHGTTVAASSRATSQHEAGGREHPPHDGDGAEPHHQRRWRRAGSPG